MRQRAFAGIVCLVIVFLLCFCNKPFHIDDVYFIEIAENILKHPTNPFSGAVTLLDYDYYVFKNSGITPNTFSTMSHPPLVPYVEAGVAYFCRGFKEIPIHVAFIIFPILCAFSIYFLANRFTPHPLASTFLFVVSPLFLVKATNLMTDIPMMALGLLALSCFIFGIDSQKRKWIFLAGVFTGFAMLTRYVAFGLIPLCIIYAMSKKEKFLNVLLMLIPAIFIFSIWMIENLLHHGETHLIASSKHYALFYGNTSFGGPILLEKTISSISAIGGTQFIGFLFFMFAALNRKRNAAIFLCSLLFVTGLFIFQPFGLTFLSQYSTIQFVLLILFVSAGLFFCISAIAGTVLPSEECFSSDYSFLKLWLFGAVVSSIILLPFGTGRYMLPALPPLIFLLTSQIRWSAMEKQVGRILGILVVASSFLFATLLAIADYQHALSYKNFADQLKIIFRGSRVWFVGDWDFRYYMEENGYQYLLSTDNSPSVGDLIVKAHTAALHDFSASLHQRSSLLRTDSIHCQFPIRLMSPQARAGFYSHGFGLLPFSFSRVPLEEFDIYKVEKSARD